VRLPEARDERLRSVVRTAELFRKRIWVLSGVALRYCFDDIEFLDEYLEELRQKGASKQVLTMMGAYFAEVLRRNIGGVYEFDKVRQELALVYGGVKCFPIMKVRRAYAAQEDAPLQNYCFAFARGVAKALR